MLLCEKYKNYKNKPEDSVIHMPLTVDKASQWFIEDENFYKFLKFLNSKYTFVTWDFLWFQADSFKVKEK